MGRQTRAAAERVRADRAIRRAARWRGGQEDWQRRLRAAGGSVGYVAAAGVDHRRTGRDATLRALSRANFYRGRFARRYDVYKGAEPSFAAELRTLAGCVFHVVRRRCGVGVTLAALTLGRLVEALDPAPAPPASPIPTICPGARARSAAAPH